MDIFKDIVVAAGIVIAALLPAGLVVYWLELDKPEASTIGIAIVIAAWILTRRAEGNPIFRPKDQTATLRDQILKDRPY